MKPRALLTVILVVLLVLPLVLLAFMNRDRVTTPFKLLRVQMKSRESAQYSVQSNVSGVTLTLVDTRYLEYVAANLEIFGNQSVVDPRIYRGFPELPLRYTISRIRFVLVPTIDQFLVGVSGSNDFAARGDFAVEDQTLIVRVSINFNEQGNPQAGQYQLEDVFLRAALLTLYYAHGLTDSGTNAKIFREIQEDIKTYVYQGIFEWPIRISQ